MALFLWRKTLDHYNSTTNPVGCFVASVIRRKKFFPGNNLRIFQEGYVPRFGVLDQVLREYGFFCSKGLGWEASSNEVVLKKFELALKDRNVKEAWARFKDFNSLYGLPDHTLLNRFITQLSYSTKPQWLQKACDLVSSISEREPHMVHRGVLPKLSISLARALMPEPASIILRLMLEKEMIPSIDVYRIAFLHMVKSEFGACLACNVLMQLCQRCLCLGCKRVSQSAIRLPDTMMFNLVLDACVRFKMSLKGQALVELMAQTGVVADAHSIVLISCLDEMNGHCSNLEKLKEIVGVPSFSVTHYKQFYENLLIYYFRFDDIDSAEKLILDLCKSKTANSIQGNMRSPYKPRFLSLGSDHIRCGLKLRIEPELWQKDTPLGIGSKADLLVVRDTKLFPTNMALAKVICRYKRHGNTDKLSNLLLGIQKEMDSSKREDLPTKVVDACISLGWLELAHDIMDDMESSGILLGSVIYKTLLISYHRKGMSRNVEALLKKMKKMGMFSITSAAELTSFLLSEAESKNTQTDLVKCLAQEVYEEKKSTPPIHKLNSTVYYFSRTRMVGDTLAAYRKMKEMNIEPTAQTFSYMIELYSSLQKYREVTILWGDIKRNIEARGLRNHDLLELLVMNFLKGGYFERVLEVIAYMSKNGIYTDKGMYRSEFLKIHKNLYKSLKANKAQTEAQRKRLEHVKMFRRWLGIG